MALVNIFLGCSNNGNIDCTKIAWLCVVDKFSARWMISRFSFLCTKNKITYLEVQSPNACRVIYWFWFWISLFFISYYPVELKCWYCKCMHIICNYRKWRSKGDANQIAYDSTCHGGIETIRKSLHMEDLCALVKFTCTTSFESNCKMMIDISNKFVSLLL